MKIAVFIDYWNLQLTLNQGLSAAKGVEDYRAKIDWQKVGTLFAQAACGVLGVEQATLSYEGSHIAAMR